MRECPFAACESTLGSPGSAGRSGRKAGPERLRHRYHSISGGLRSNPLIHDCFRSASRRFASNRAEWQSGAWKGGAPNHPTSNGPSARLSVFGSGV
jgi:hypothetical protein